MFDRQTSELIESAPELSNLDQKRLPKALAEAYAKIVSSRIRLRSTEGSSVENGDIRSIQEEMRRLASTQEALFALSNERDSRRASAFVAGVAHHVVVQAKALEAGRMMPPRLKLNAIPAEVSATLLFLAAEAHADAAEMAKHLVAERESGEIEAALIGAIANLAKGQLLRVVEVAPPPAEQILRDPGSPGASGLYLMLLQVVRSISHQMLGESDQSYRNLLDQVDRLAIRTIGSGPGGAMRRSACVYPGPAHLSSLIRGVADSLPNTSLAHLPPPDGIDGQRWRKKMHQISGKRPYLWRNHLEAIECGYLSRGTSSVVSFPTGAGKSTLSELKIASTLLGGSKVVFLAPTLALVDQVTRSLKQLFPNDEVEREKSEASLEDLIEGGLPDISVMTPERCLALLGFDGEAFSEVGLLVFDECHLMHGNYQAQSRRSIDAMLCILNFAICAPNSDFLLLSAMMSNAQEISEWIESSFNRECLALSLDWKPTRQVRGVLVYASADTSKLNSALQQAHRMKNTIHAPAKVSSTMTARPFGFLGLNQTWITNARADYLLTPLLDSPVPLATATSKSGGWYLTPNGVKVAAAIAAGAASREPGSPRLKTLVFAPTIVQAKSAAKEVARILGSSKSVLTEDERRHLEAAILELGAKEMLYLSIDATGAVTSSALTHHGHLLPDERALHESLYRRENGVDVLVATSTLAQGMNLPSQVVIIASDQRFDVEEEQMETMEAHELLNAAGRAGRAGESSYGFVLVVPGKVMHFDNSNSLIHSHWKQLKAVFSQSDQCLAIEDPLEAVLDAIHSQTSSLDENSKYLLRRLPAGKSSSSDAEATSLLLKRSLAAYQKQRKGDSNWLKSRVAAAVSARNSEEIESEDDGWIGRLASSAGIDSSIIRGLANALSSPPPEHANIVDWVEWVFEWLSTIPGDVPRLIREDSLKGLFGKPYKGLQTDEERGEYCLPLLRRLLLGWMHGKTLGDLELDYGTATNKLGNCENARKFVLKTVPDLSYICGLPEQVLRAIRKDTGEEGESPASCAMLSSCVREGYDRVEKLALAYVLNRSTSRRLVHSQWSGIDWIVLSALHPEVWGETLKRVRSGYQVNQNVG